MIVFQKESPQTNDLGGTLECVCGVSWESIYIKTVESPAHSSTRNYGLPLTLCIVYATGYHFYIKY